jgi:hypothetical protein
MGWMDKAKQLAEQAQQKLDEAQKQFNSGQPQHQDGGQGVTYDEHGRAQADPAAAADPSAPPVASPDPEAPPEQTPPAPSGDSANSTPDPFKPLQ